MYKEEIILPWNKPFVSLVPTTDMVLSIAANRPEICLPSLCENFINIRYQTSFAPSRFANFVGDHSEWYRYKFLSVQTVPHWLLDFNSLCDFIYEALRQKNYIICNINTKYIHNYINFGKRDFRHTLSIYGISGETLHICDYFNYQIRTNGICTIEEFRLALQDFIDALKQQRAEFQPQLKDQLNGILLFKENDTFEEFEISKLLFELKSFLHPNTNLQKNQKITYGIDFFKVLSNDLGSEIINQNTVNYSRHFQLIYAHAKLMKLRVQFLNEHYAGELDLHTDLIDRLETNALITRNNYLKAQIKKENTSQFYREISSKVYDFYNRYSDYLNDIEQRLEALA